MKKKYVEVPIPLSELQLERIDLLAANHEITRIQFIQMVLGSTTAVMLWSPQVAKDKDGKAL